MWRMRHGGKTLRIQSCMYLEVVLGSVRSTTPPPHQVSPTQKSLFDCLQIHLLILHPLNVTFRHLVAELLLLQPLLSSPLISLLSFLSIYTKFDNTLSYSLSTHLLISSINSTLVPCSLVSVNYISSDSSLILLQRYTVPDELKLTAQPLNKMTYLSDVHIACTYRTSIPQRLQQQEQHYLHIINLIRKERISMQQENKSRAVSAPGLLSAF